MNYQSFKKIYKDYSKRIDEISPEIDQRFVDEAAHYQSSLHSFIKGAWPIIEGGREFVDGWHLQAICEHLEAVYKGQIRKLLINEPPRCMKSTAFPVCMPAWIWTEDPSFQFLFLSYVSRLTIRDSVKCRRIINSKWYQERWGHKFKLLGDVNSKIRFDNNKTGYRIATSIGGAGTGEGGDIIGIDDPNDAGETESDVIRESTNEWCDHVLSTRLNNPKTGRVVIVQQRLHSQDYSGHILSKEVPDLVHLCLPMEFEISRKCITIPLPSTNGKPWKDPRIKEGDLLWPERFGPKEVQNLKSEMNSEYVIAGQLQQRPSPQQGGILKKDWFQWWKQPSPPRCHFVIQSWDTALSKEVTACYSCCTTWGVFKDDNGIDNVILLDIWHGRVEYPDLRKMAIRLANNYHDTHIDYPTPEDYILKPDMIIIEAKANGLSLLQDLNRAGLIVNRFDPVKHGGGDKTVRARLMSHVLMAGRIWVPAKPPNYTSLRNYADIFVNACAGFPNDRDSRDYVDSMSQAIIRLLLSGLVGNPDDEEIRINYNKWENEKFY